jgi:uncharacterized protein YgbK (DUF1537 family)
VTDRFIPPNKQPRVRRASAAAIRRLLASAEKAGLDVAGFEALPDGTVRVFDARTAPQGLGAAAPSLFDRLEEQGKL